MNKTKKCLFNIIYITFFSGKEGRMTNIGHQHTLHNRKKKKAKKGQIKSNVLKVESRGVSELKPWSPFEMDTKLP